MNVRSEGLNRFRRRFPGFCRHQFQRRWRSCVEISKDRNWMIRGCMICERKKSFTCRRRWRRQQRDCFYCNNNNNNNNNKDDSNISNILSFTKPTSRLQQQQQQQQQQRRRLQRQRRQLSINLDCRLEKQADELRPARAGAGKFQQRINHARNVIYFFFLLTVIMLFHPLCLPMPPYASLCLPMPPYVSVCCSLSLCLPLCFPVRPFNVYSPE